MKQTAVEWLENQYIKHSGNLLEIKKSFEKAKEMESKQLFLASNTSAKDAYKAGQKTMQCGCYEISDALTYEEWLYENFKSQKDEE
jgi:DNA primase large subunit